ncbi:MAG: hypothetical protein RR998_04895 [Oscillospiraceae bacterium]
MGSHQTADSVSAPREFHPSEDLSKLPSLVATDCGQRRFTLDFMTGQEYLSIACYRQPGAARQLQPTVSRLLPEEQTKDKSECEVLLFSSAQVMAQSLMWLMLITIAMGKCLMNEYSVVKELWRSQYKDLSLYLPLSERSDNHKNLIFKKRF